MHVRRYRQEYHILYHGKSPIKSILIPAVIKAVTISSKSSKLFSIFNQGLIIELYHFFFILSSPFGIRSDNQPSAKVTWSNSEAEHFHVGHDQTFLIWIPNEITRMSIVMSHGPIKLRLEIGLFEVITGAFLKTSIDYSFN